MPIRRCALMTLEPRERLEFDLAGLLDGGTGLGARLEWIAIAPHTTNETVVSDSEAAALGAISPSRWSEADELERAHSREVIDSLLEKGLLIADGSEADARDRLARDTGWRCASAAMHYASRWRGVDTEEVQRNFTDLYGGDLLKELGPAPPPVRERAQAHERIALPAAAPTPLDALLDGRVTCRNFDPARSLPAAQFAAVLYRAFGARVVDDYAPGVQLLKKGVPSAGGLHPTEAYLLIQRVDGIAPGLYHYHAVDHALEPMRELSAAAAAALARTFVGAQAYFVDAPVLVVPVTRFRRNFWKYRNHAKAYRALVLDVGHLSQTLYLAATELGLAAFITAAVNEIDIEEAFGLDPLEEGPLAVCGFGTRGDERKSVEFDPLHAVWKAG
jgi:putative peptide maturation dehydrogenase